MCVCCWLLLKYPCVNQIRHPGEGRQHEDELVELVSYPSDTCEEFSPLIVLFRLPVTTGLGFVTQGI